MVILSSDSFSYYATRKDIKFLFFFFNPNVSMRTVLKFHEFLRKGLHVFNFAVLSWFVLCAKVRTFKPISKWTGRIALMCILYCVLYSVFEEWRQSLSLTRTPRLLDIFLDTGGAIAAQMICGFVWWFTRRNDASRNPV